MRIILISGKARHGKNSAADFLGGQFQQEGARVLHIAFADYVKFICGMYYHWDGSKDDAGRHLLQHVSTEVFRQRDENFWVDTVIRYIKMVWDDYDAAFIPDFRFPNEIRRWKDFGVEDVITVRVERPGFESELEPEQKLHSSETALDGYPFDYYLTAADLEELEERCAALAARINPVKKANTNDN